MLALELGEYIAADGSRKIISLKEVIPEPGTGSNCSEEISGFWQPASTVSMIRGLCDATCIIHKQAIIHRDLKPSNILMKKSPGHNQVKPFILDFNVSVRSGAEFWKGGTERYLPPEVRSGNRQQPDFADDLWALSVILWEMLFGLGQSIKKGAKPHKHISFQVSTDLTEVLLKALSPKPEQRYSSAQDFYEAVDTALSPLGAKQRVDGLKYTGAKRPENLVSEDDIVWARENRSRILEGIRYTLAGEYELPISKQVKDKVAFLYSSMLREETHSFNMKQDLLQLGTKAIPEIIEESHKIPVGNPTLDEVVGALAELSSLDANLAKRSIRVFCVSSDFVVRKICFRLCEAIKFFPDNLIYNILEDDALYLPQERVDFADLCIRFSEDESVLLALTKYMSREYILDRSTGKYIDLSNKIAKRINELSFENKAKAIVEDAQMRIWEELPEYESLDINVRGKVDRGLLELFADAFAALKEEALKLAKTSGLPERCEKGELLIARVFWSKLAQSYAPGRALLFEKLKEKSDRELYNAALRLRDLSPGERAVLQEMSERTGIGTNPAGSLEEAFERYLSTGRGLHYLRENGDQTLDLVEKVIREGSGEIMSLRLLNLLDFFRRKLRRRVVKILIDNWSLFAVSDYPRFVFVMTEYGMPDDGTKDRVVDQLSKDMSITERKSTAVDGIEKLLR